MSKPKKPTDIECEGHAWAGIGYQGQAHVETYSGVTRSKDARRLADWLNRWADWREAQGG